MTTNDIAESDDIVNSDFFEILHLEDLHKPILQVVKHLFQVYGDLWKIMSTRFCWIYA